MKKMLKRLIKTEKGQALPMVLILMVIGGLILAPTLTYTTSGLKVGQAYKSMAEEFYAADAGIEDGLWQIKYDHLPDLFGDYERYDYDTTYEYPTTYTVDVNNIDVDIEIENIWIPDIDEPANLDEANRLAETDKLIVAGCVSAELTQQLKIHYKQETGDPDLYITSIGVWLPPGFSYDELGESSLALTDALAAAELSYSLVPYPYKGGEAIVWTFSEPAPFTSLPGVSTMDTPMTCTLTFNFKRNDPTSQRNPEAVSWITTSGVADFPYSWDADVRVFHIKSYAEAENSITDGTTIDAYAIKSDPRQLVSGINGDYRAIGNTLMLNQSPDPYGPVRDYLLEDSDATVNDIPDNAVVEAAFLYWSAWVIEDTEEIPFSDGCSDMQQWIPGGAWSVWFGQFRGHYYGGVEDSRYLTMHENYAVDLSMYESETVTISWNQSASGVTLNSQDCLKFQFYNETDGWGEEFLVAFCGSNPEYNFSYVIPDEYMTENFLMRFYLQGFSARNEYVYLDNVKISAELEEPETIADIEVRFEINGEQVYLEDDEYGNPTVPAKGPQGIEANSWKTQEILDTSENDYSYCSKVDVTPLVQEYTAHGNATYTVGDVEGTVDSEWSYAGWSLIIIYSSPETQRHQLYLFDLNTDDFRYIKPHTTGVSFPISGFLVPDPIRDPDTGEITETTAATITCFLGDGDDFYSGDFIAINAPEGLEGHEIPNSYKLWDGIELYAPHSWPLPRMDNIDGSPNNVWNGRSEGFGGSFIDGVDIDTFYVPWGDPPSDGLLKPGDSSATIELNFADPNPSYAELINFIYIIIAFRSETVTGGTVSYLIEG